MFFAPPKLVEASIFATLPDKYRDTDSNNEWIRGQPGAPAQPVLEGPVFDQNGYLYCVDIPGGRIFRVDQTGHFDLAVQYDGWPNGLKIMPDGRFLIADYKNGLMSYDPGTGQVQSWLTRYGLEPFKGVNDLFVASNGDVYFTDQGMTGLHDPTGRVFRMKQDGRVECLLANIPSPNGIVMNVDESCIFVAATRDNSIWRIALKIDGSVSKVGKFIQLSGGGGPDGLAIDEEDRLIIAHVGLGSVWVFDRKGEPVLRVSSPSGTHTTNIAFGGPQRKNLFITEATSSTILTTQLDIPGKTRISI